VKNAVTADHQAGTSQSPMGGAKGPMCGGQVGLPHGHGVRSACSACVGFSEGQDYAIVQRAAHL
jgi:hypothetical protein